MTLRWAIVLLVCAGCKKQAAPPPPPETRALPTLPASELKRGHDACQAYVDKACACADTVPAAKQRCSDAHALADAIQVGADVATNPDSTRRDAVQTNVAVRGVVKECIEQLAKLPVTGCP
jgi:hypothetical protein